ncbi:MAG: hypothetical protein ABIP20_01375 [Chthoniobacteraceae bacterium]
MKPAAEIIRILRALRWRMALGDLLRAAARAALFFFAILLVLTAAAWWRGGMRPNPADIPIALSWPFVFGAFAALLLTLLRFPRLERVARSLDLAGATRDRFVTGLRLAEKGRASELEVVAMTEIAGWARDRKLGPLLPVRFPRELLWIAAPIGMIAMLWWDAMNAAAAKDQLAAQETAAISETAKQLEHIAKLTDIQANENQEKELRLIAERLRQSAEQMRAEAADGKDARKAALRELAMLEDLVKELRRPEAATPEELKALTEALAKHEQTREAAKDIAGGNLAAAAKKLAQAAGQQDEPSAEAMRETLKQALDHLAEKREQVSKQIEKLQQQAAGGRQDLLKKIADLLNEMQPQSKTAGRDGKGAQQDAQKKMTDEDLQRLLGALEGLKDQQQQQGEGPQGGAPQPGDPKDGDPERDGKVAMLNFSSGERPGGDSQDSINSPSGKPGNDGDKDTTKDPFGAKSAASKNITRKEQDAGQLGVGESLSVLIPSAAAGDEKAERRYRELYDAASFIAEDAVTQENIPLGARFLIRRYFQAIRPKQ